MGLNARDRNWVDNWEAETANQTADKGSPPLPRTGPDAITGCSVFSSPSQHQVGQSGGKKRRYGPEPSPLSACHSAIASFRLSPLRFGRGVARVRLSPQRSPGRD